MSAPANRQGTRKRAGSARETGNQRPKIDHQFELMRISTSQSGSCRPSLIRRQVAP